MSDEDKKKDPRTHLTNRQRQFVSELVANPISATEAAKRAYNTTTPKSAQNTASRLMNRPDIRAALEVAYQEVWPDAERDTITRLMSIVRDGKDSDAIAAIREIAKMKGYNQPSQKQVITAKLKLPGSD